MDKTKIVDNTLADMDEIGDWVSIADAVQANGINSFNATREQVCTVVEAIMHDDRTYMGVLDGGLFQKIDDAWTPSSLVEHIFDQENRIAAMMDILIDKY